MVPANRVVAGECRPSGSLRYVSHIDGVYGCGALPARNSFPHTDSFRWYVTDGRAVSDVVTGNIRVEYVNMPPTSVGPASASTSEDTPASFTLSGLDPDGDPFAYLVNALPRHGSLRVLEGSGPRQITAVPTLLLAAADGTTSLQYVPDADFNTLTQGDDFHSQLTDGSVPRNCDYTVRFDVAPVNDAPGGIGQPTGVYGIAVTDDARPTDVLSIPLRAQGAAAGGIDIVDPSGFALRRVSATQVQFDGTLTAINALLDRGVQFTPNGSGATYGELAIIVDDRGNFGSGGPRVGTQIVAVDVGSDGDGGLESIRDGARATTRRPPLAPDRR